LSDCSAAAQAMPTGATLARISFDKSRYALVITD
jgi:hypothetical protein